MDSITRIQLIDGHQGFLDVKEGTVFPLNFGIADIRDVSSKSGTFSKSITLSGSKNNNKLLNSYFDINIQAGTFNINRITNCAVIQNGIVILDNATLQLVSVNKKQTQGAHDAEVTYTVVIKDSTSDFFKEINNKLLTDLDFSDLNHIYTAANVINSFDNTIVDGYKYLMPHNPSVSADTKFNLEEFTPTLYAQNYLDRIFAESGFGYSWPALTADTVMFDKLVIPYNGDKPTVSTATNEAASVSANTTTYQTITYTGPTGNVDDIGVTHLNIDNELKDDNNNYNPTTSIYTVPGTDTNMTVSFKIEVNYDLYYENNSGANAHLLPIPNGLGGVYGVKVTPYIGVYKNSSATNALVNITKYPNSNYPIPTGTVVPNGITTIASGVDKIISSTIFTAISNDSIDFKLNAALRGYNTNGSQGPAFAFYTSTAKTAKADVRIKIKINSITLSILPTIKTFGYNVPIVVNDFIPKQIKQSDFIKSIFTMYNLFAEVDKDNPKVLNLTSRDDYYDVGIIQDWTKKLAKERDQELRFLPELQSKRIVLTYKQDKDSPNTTYLQGTNEVYGQMEYVFDNEYVKGKSNQELIFGASPIHNTKFGAVLPMVDGQAPKTLPRILIDGGEYSCAEYSIQNYYGNTATGNTYPHLSHWNKPTNPTFDINFGVCDFYFRDDNYGAYTNNNLFNLYWRRTMNQINTGKMLTAYFDLNEYDIQKMSLSDKIRIDNSWWNINKIIDYDANSSNLTKVELISIDDSLKIPYQNKTVKKPSKGNSIFNAANWVTHEQNGNFNTILTDYDVDVRGRGNVIDAEVKSGAVYGDYNTVLYSSIVQGSNNMVQSEAFVIGNNNTIDSNVTNAMIIGNSVSANTGGIYVDNLVVASGGSINGTTVETITSNATYWGSGTGVNSIVALSSTENYANGQDSLAVGVDTYANGIASMTQGVTTTANGNYSHAEGSNTVAGGVNSHAEGDGTESVGDGSHAEGYMTKSNGTYSHAEGIQSNASGEGSHAEGGSFTLGLTGGTASGIASKASGVNTLASGVLSIAEGTSSIASGDISHASGFGSVASRYGEWARSSVGPSSAPAGGEGQYGIVDYSRTTFNSNTITEIFIGGTTLQRLTIQSGSSYRYKITVLARIVSTSEVKEWEGNGLIKNVGGTTSMVGSSISSTFGDAGLAAATVTLSADNTNDSLKVEVTGIAATQIVWYAKVEYIQIY
jgi:hypothetical protein